MFCFHKEYNDIVTQMTCMRADNGRLVCVVY